MALHGSSKKRLEAYERRFNHLVSQLAHSGYVYPGTVGHHRIKCGKQNCACSHDPSRRHGPYTYWTTKARGKTIARLLNKDEARLIESWIANRREIESLLKQMMAVSEKMARILFNPRAEADWSDLERYVRNNKD